MRVLGLIKKLFTIYPQIIHKVIHNINLMWITQEKLWITCILLWITLWISFLENFITNWGKDL